MEDILASIRRILNEDEAAATAPAGSTDSATEPQAAQGSGAINHEHPSGPLPQTPSRPTAGGFGGADDGVLVLDEAMLVTAPQPAAPALTAGTEQTPALPDTSAPAPTAPATEPHAGLLAPESAAAAALSVESLMRTLTKERGTQVYRGGPTIEDLVREEIRPLLKGWLDQHLPPLVERLVRQEIERVVGRTKD